MGTTRVKSHTRKTKTGKTVVVRQHSKSVESTVKRALKEKTPKSSYSEKRVSRKITSKDVSEMSEKMNKLVKRRVKNEATKKHILSKYANRPMNMRLMVDAKWKTEHLDSWITNKKGEREVVKKEFRKIAFTDEEFKELVKENGGLIHKIVSSKSSYDPELYDDLKQSAVKGLYEAANNYESKYDPSNPADIQKHFSSHINGVVSWEMQRQVASRFRLPDAKNRIYTKFTQLFDEHRGDYDAIYDSLKLKKRDLYPNLSGKEGGEPLPREGRYVTVAKEEVLAKKTKTYENKVNKLKEKLEEDKAILAGRLHGGTDEDKEAYDAAERQLDKEIQKLLDKVASKSTSKSDRIDLEKRIDDLEKRKSDLSREMKPISEEDYESTLKALDNNYQSDLRDARQKFENEVGKTTIQGAYELFRELEQIMSFKDVNVGKSVEFGDGEHANVEELITHPNEVDPESRIIIRSGFIKYRDELLSKIDNLNSKTAKVVKLHLGLDEENELYAHGLWGVPMESVAEIARTLPPNFYVRLDSDYKTRLKNWNKYKPTRETTVKRTPADTKKQKQKLAEWQKSRKKAKAVISKNISKIKGLAAKQKFREKTYTKYKSTLEQKPTYINRKPIKLTKKEYDAAIKKWNAKKPKKNEALLERGLYERVRKDLSYGKIALQQSYSKSSYHMLMSYYDDMRAFNISKANLKDDLRKSLVVDRFFGVKCLRETNKNEDTIIKKAYDKIQSLFKTFFG